MERYKVAIKNAKAFSAMDTRNGEVEIAVFHNLNMCHDYVDFMNAKNKMLDIVYRQVSAEIEVEFQ